MFLNPASVDKHIWHKLLDSFVLSGVPTAKTLSALAREPIDGNLSMTTQMRRSISIRIMRLRCVCRHFCSLYARNIWLWTAVMPINPMAKLNLQRRWKLDKLWATGDWVLFDAFMAKHRAAIVQSWGASYRNKVLDNIRYYETAATIAKRKVDKMESDIAHLRHSIADEERRIRCANESITDYNECLMHLPAKRTVVRKKSKISPDDEEDE
jgi:IS1 family transposase